MNIASILATKGAQAVTVRPELSVREALGLLARHNIGALIVVEGADRPVGILSERDIVREAARNESVFDRTVAEIMTRDVITAQRDHYQGEVDTLQAQLLADQPGRSH